MTHLVGMVMFFVHVRESGTFIGNHSRIGVERDCSLSPKSIGRRTSGDVTVVSIK